MSSDEALDEAVASWRTTHHIREDDPMMAALDLVRVYLAHAPRPSIAACAPLAGQERRPRIYRMGAKR